MSLRISDQEIDFRICRGFELRSRGPGTEKGQALALFLRAYAFLLFRLRQGITSLAGSTNPLTLAAMYCIKATMNLACALCVTCVAACSPTFSIAFAYRFSQTAHPSSC